MATQGTKSRARRGRYDSLILFWVVILGAAAVGAVVLQAEGPIGPIDENTFVTPKKPAPPAPPPGSVAAPDLALQEAAPDFPGRMLPQIGPNGRTPAAAYAAPFDITDKPPKVALVIAGLGLDQDQTLHVINDLPGAVDIAYSPYMPEAHVDKLLARARAAGHECLASIPMEPSGFPLTEEGAHALLTGADPEQNRQNLEWALSRVPGCVGATGASDGLMGERYAQTGLGFAALLAETSKRGLIYLDPRTGAPALTDAPVGTYVADLVIDAAPNADEPMTADLIDRRLALLAKIAAEHGSAIGLAGPPRAILLERIAVWLHSLPARGITLVPLTAIPAPPPKPADDQQ